MPNLSFVRSNPITVLAVLSGMFGGIYVGNILVDALLAAGESLLLAPLALLLLGGVDGEPGGPLAALADAWYLVAALTLIGGFGGSLLA